MTGVQTCALPIYVEALLDRVDLVLDAGQSYHTFSGLKDDMSGSVKFIIRTEAIEK